MRYKLSQSPRSAISHAAFALLCAAALLAGCAVERSTPAFSHQSSLSPDASAAIEFRATYGLSKDLAFVEAVALDPAAQASKSQFGVPLLPAEVAELKARAANVQRVASTIERYGRRHPEDWAGMFIDNEGSGAVVAQFGDHVDEHEAAIRSRVGPLARVEVRRVRWSTAALTTLLATVEAEKDWFRSIDSWYEWGVVSELNNRVEVSLSSRNPRAIELTLEHFNGDGWLQAVSDGIGHWEGGFGSLVVELVDTGGRPVVGPPEEAWRCRLEPIDATAWRGGSLAMAEGRCESSEPLGATLYTVTVTKTVGVSEVIVARGTVRVPADGTGRLRLVYQSTRP